MKKELFEKICKKEGHRPKITIINMGMPIDIDNAELTLECCNCGAVSAVKGKWENPTK